MLGAVRARDDGVRQRGEDLAFRPVGFGQELDTMPAAV